MLQQERDKQRKHIKKIYKNKIRPPALHFLAGKNDKLNFSLSGPILEGVWVRKSGFFSEEGACQHFKTNASACSAGEFVFQVAKTIKTDF